MNSMLSALIEYAKSKNIDEGEARKVFNLIPDSLKETQIMKHPLKKQIMLYEFGNPYNNIGDNNTVVFGSDQFPEISVLFNGIRSLIYHTNYSVVQLRTLCKKLEDRDKHLDFLSELDPIMRPSVDFKAKYEEQSYAKDGKNIDWLISFEDGTSFLIDVKNRIKALIENLSQNNESLQSAPSAKSIFDSLEEKFNVTQNTMLQGVWIRTDIYYDDNSLREEFNKLDKNKLQFAVLTHFEGEARILSWSEEIKKNIISKFSLTEMKKKELNKK